MPLAAALGVPCVITLTGTDVTHDVHLPEYAPIARGAMEASTALVALRPSQLDELRAAGVAVPSDTVVIPQGVAVPRSVAGHQGDAPGFLRARIGVARGADTFVLFLPAGLRPVKAQHVAIAALEELTRSGWPGLHLVLAGPVLDEEYTELLRQRAVEVPGVHLVGTLPHSEMGDALADADVVLNTSESEGESNALLEAQAAGRVIVARRNAGNTALVRHGADGWLFDDLPALVGRLRWVRDHPAEAAAVARAAAERAHASPEREARAHLELYDRLIRRTS